MCILIGFVHFSIFPLLFTCLVRLNRLLMLLSRPRLHIEICVMWKIKTRWECRVKNGEKFSKFCILSAYLVVIDIPWNASKVSFQSIYIFWLNESILHITFYVTPTELARLAIKKLNFAFFSLHCTITSTPLSWVGSVTHFSWWATCYLHMEIFCVLGSPCFSHRSSIKYLIWLHTVNSCRCFWYH